MTFLDRIFGKTSKATHAQADIVDNLTTHDSAQALITKKRSLSDKAGISTRWTITKNKGRANEQVACNKKLNVITNGGRDYILNRIYGTAAIGADTNVDRLALSSNQVDPLAADTTFPGEIVLTDLRRTGANTGEDVGVLHAVGENDVDLSYEYTATQAHSDIHKAALFESAIATRPVHAIAFTTDVDLAIDDTLTVEINVIFDTA